MSSKALLVVDMQNDFLPGGALSVPHSEEIIPLINALMKLPFKAIIATKYYHPPGHSSFASSWKKNVGERIIIDGVEQILWPDHCVEGTYGAEFSPQLEKSRVNRVIYKGTDRNIDSYSAFFDNRKLRSTGLEEYLRKLHIDELYIAGLATDYCVLYSTVDAQQLGFRSRVVTSACRAVNLMACDEERALKAMKDSGAVCITVEEAMKAFTRQ